MKKKILVTRNLLPENEERIKKLFDVKLNKQEKLYTSEEILELSKDCNGILCIGGNKFDADIFSKISSTVKIIASYSVGYNNIDIDAATKKGIVVTNTPEVLTDATADIAILLLLGASRRAYEARKSAEEQEWAWATDFLLGKQMSGSNLGILGMGRIGRAIAERARGFGMKIHYHNRTKLSADFEQGAIYHDSIKSLFSYSDFLSINCPATKETAKIINEETISYLPNGVVISNTARGDVVDDEAMIKALKNGKIFALGLDVYNGEPKIHPEYLKIKNIFLLPHLGSSTLRTRIAMGNRSIDNLENFFQNKRPKDQLN